MIFSELYSVYYNTVAEILTKACENPISQDEIFDIVSKNGFGESVLNIPDELKNENWQLLTKTGKSILKNQPKMPLTNLQKSWLKSISNDERIKLFSDFTFNSDFDEIEPLFLPEDIFVFDKYSDGDDFSNEEYKKNFRLILDAIKNQYCLELVIKNRKDEIRYKIISPAKLEFSEKDDKFRLIGRIKRDTICINLSRIIDCKKADSSYKFKPLLKNSLTECVTFILHDERRALERTMLHFAHFKKQAEFLGQNKYKIQLFYDKEDETEILIRILSFGPMIKVIEPQNFIELIKERLSKQKSLI